MTERLAEISAHIEGIRALGAVINATRGIAGARAQQARAQLPAVDGYAKTIGEAIGRVLALLPQAQVGRTPEPHVAVLVFCAEQGFAGNFSERVLDALGGRREASLFVVGTRGASIAAARGLVPAGTNPMPSHSTGIPRFADIVAAALYDRIARGEIDRIEVIYERWEAGKGLGIERRLLLPLDSSVFPSAVADDAPLLNLSPATLLDQLTADYVHAQICRAALHAFAAENEARMQAMASARRELDRQLTELRRRQRIIRQDEITAEIIELASGQA